MAHYDDSLSLGDARRIYFADNDFGSDGGYGKKWVELKLLGTTLFFPNTKGRVRAVKLHDLDHVITGYETNLAGEVEISGFEIGTGCGSHSAAWMLNLQTMFVGLFINPVRMFRAFRRGRRSRTLYDREFDESLLAQTVGELRERQQLCEGSPEIGAADLLGFAFWWSVAALLAVAEFALLLSPIALLVWLL